MPPCPAVDPAKAGLHVRAEDTLTADESGSSIRLLDASKETPMGSHRHSDRRQFLTESAALAGLAVGVPSAEAQTPQPAAPLKDNLAYGQPSRFDNTVRKATGAGTAITDTALTTPLQDLDGIITPSGLHFLMDHVNG